MRVLQSFPGLRRAVIKTGKHSLRKLGNFQARHSLVSTEEVIANEEFPWAERLAKSWRVVRTELDRVLERPEDIPAFHQLSPDQKRISKGDNWKTYALFVFGQRVELNCTECPNTAAFLEELPGLQNAWFSILAPHYHILPHKGPTRALCRCHLGLIVPADPAQCWIRVGGRICHWHEGEVLIFDDTYEHEVFNDSDEVRVVLFIDVDRPMDKIGAVFNRLLLRALKASTYVKTPLANLAQWNSRRT